MKKIILGIFLLLSSCAITPDMPKFPDVPEELKVSCQDLLMVKEGETKLSETLKVVTANYELYHECQLKNNSWKEWYDTQKNIFEEIK